MSEIKIRLRAIIFNFLCKLGWHDWDDFLIDDIYCRRCERVEWRLFVLGEFEKMPEPRAEQIKKFMRARARAGGEANESS